MSDRTVWSAPDRRVASALRQLVRPRSIALAGGAVLTVTYLSILHHVLDVVGGVVGTGGFLAVALGSVVVAAICARFVRPGWALLLGLGLLSVGLVGYLLAVPPASLDAGDQLADTASLLSGMSVLRVMRADVWVLGLTPGPVFLSWYFLGRRSYALGVLVGGATTGFFALSGDLTTVQVLVGVLGGAVAVGFGQLDREGTDPTLRNGVVVVLVAMLVVTTSLSLVPGGDARPLLPDRGPTTVEASLTGADARVNVLGSITLSPTVRFTVSAPASRYWRVGAYDRYTGDGWVRTGDTRPYREALPPPEGEDARPFRQTFVAETAVSTMPAAWKPVALESAPGPVLATDLGGLQPRGGLQAGEQYAVVSMVPERSPPRLRRAGTDYPAAVEARYLALPESTPGRLERFTANLTAADETPYEKARTIETWLESNKDYSLDVDRPEGDVATAFVFEMEAGYCTYYATAMAAMLRAQGIPARLVVGYLPGEAVGEDEWLVRGFDSHAWVEVYVPDAGWVQFDPTPAGPRQAVERDSLAVARAAGEPNVDVNASAPPTTATPVPTTNGTDSAAGAGGATDTPPPPTESPAGGSGDSVFWAAEVLPDAGGPSTQTLLYALVLLLGAATAAVRLGLATWGYRLLWLRRLPDGPPGARVEAAVERGEYLLGRRYRPRRVGETRRAYLEALDGGTDGPELDDRAVALFRLGERARYGGRATEGDAAEAARLLGALRTKSGRTA